MEKYVVQFSVAPYITRGFEYAVEAKAFAMHHSAGTVHKLYVYKQTARGDWLVASYYNGEEILGKEILSNPREFVPATVVPASLSRDEWIQRVVALTMTRHQFHTCSACASPRFADEECQFCPPLTVSEMKEMR